MKTYTLNLINATTLIIMGFWAYFGSETPSITALIPVFAGIILLLFFKGFKSGNKTIAHIVVILTFITLVALIKPLSGALSRNDGMAIFRVLAMIVTGSLAMVFYVKSFIDVRRNRK